MGDHYHQDGGGRGGHHGGGWKRRREHVEPELPPLKVLLATLIQLGDDALHQTGALHVEEDVLTAVVKQTKREARSTPQAVQTMLLDCAVELSTKGPLYALLVGLLNVDEPELVAGLVAQATADISTGLALGGDSRRARLLVRFLAELVAVNAVHASAVLALLQAFVDAAAAVATACGGAQGDGRAWQPYSDLLVQIALLALPFGGPELAQAVPTQVQSLLSAVEAYMGQRPRASSPALRPFSAPITEEDKLAESDNGAASFLPQVVEAVQQMVEQQHWQLLSVPHLHADWEPALAEGQAHDLPAVDVPTQVPVAVPEGASPSLAGALVLAAYPPRGIIHFLEPKHTVGDRPLMERLVAEEYILDTVASFEADRVECAKRLANNLPLPWGHEPLLCEVLFSQMLRLPKPQFKTIMYHSLMVDICKLKALFPRAMSTCMRTCFERMSVLDPGLRGRLAEYLAYHLSNFRYIWPWEKWEQALAAPPYDAQRRFIVAVLNRLVRLSYWDRVASIMPDNYKPLLPPKPEVQALPSPEDASAAQADLEGLWAARMLQRVREKAAVADLEEWMAKNELEAVLEGQLGVLRCLGRCLLVAGSKSYTHMVIALERYYGPLSNLVQALGLEGEVALVDTACHVWRSNPQRAGMAVDRLMTLRLASAEAIIAWVFDSEGVTSNNDESLSATAWEILYNAINKSIARVQDAQEDLQAGQAQVGQAQAALHALAEAGQPAEAAGEQLELALQAQAEKEAYLAETVAQQQNAVVQTVAAFVDALQGLEGDGAAMEEDTAADGAANGSEEGAATERAARRQYTLACLKSFARQYNLQLAEVAERLATEVPGAPDDLLL